MSDIGVTLTQETVGINARHVLVLTQSLTGFAIQLLGGIFGALSLPDWNFNYLLQRDAVRN
jgi:hypothetical protein